MRKTKGKIWLLLAAFLATGAAEKSAATVVPLGSVSSATSLNFGNSGLLAPFSDSYLFTIDAGKTLDFSSFISTGFVTIYGISNFEGSLFNSSGLLASGVSSTRYLPEGFPAFDVSVSSVILNAGDYTLQLTGSPNSARGASAAYSGTATFNEVVGAVPEPATFALAGLALLGLGLSRHRKGASQAG